MSINNNPAQLRKHLKQLREQQKSMDTRRGALLIRGRLFTWHATSRAALEEAGKPNRLQSVAAFWSLEQEPELQPLLYQWVEEDGLSVSLPYINEETQLLEFRLWTPDTPMPVGPYGIPQPDGPAAPLPEVVLVPTLGFTRTGDRLGYGKGYYDRTLAALKEQGHHFVSIGIAWACGDLSDTNYQPASHDVTLDSVLTDKGWAVAAPTVEQL